MQATVFFHSREWLQLVGELKSRIAAELPDASRSNVHIGIGINNAKLCGGFTVMHTRRAVHAGRGSTECSPPGERPRMLRGNLHAATTRTNQQHCVTAHTENAHTPALPASSLI